MKNYIVEISPGSYLVKWHPLEVSKDPKSAWVDLEENLLDLAEDHNITLFVLKEVDLSYPNYIK